MRAQLRRTRASSPPAAADRSKEEPRATSPSNQTSAAPVEPELIAELLDIDGDRAVLDEKHLRKQPDWTFNAASSGSVPVEILSGVRPKWRRDQ